MVRWRNLGFFSEQDSETDKANFEACRRHASFAQTYIEAALPRDVRIAPDGRHGPAIRTGKTVNLPGEAP